MEDVLSKLKKIYGNLDQIGRDMDYEGKVWKAELEDRLAKGLTGNDAIRHYNEWMVAAGLQSNAKLEEE